MPKKDQRNKNWIEIQAALKELIGEINFLVVCPTKEQIQSMADAYKTLHCHAKRFVEEQKQEEVKT